MAGLEAEGAETKSELVVVFELVACTTAARQKR